jgi:cyclohexanone monooxygenase
VTISVPQTLNEQAVHVTYMVTEARKRGHNVLEAAPEAENAYLDELQSLARLGRRFYEECTPGYYNSEGEKGNKGGLFSDMYGGGPLMFFKVLEDWRASGNLPGIATRKA